ncbi:MAG TPA: hypothetical protein DIW07_07535 [Lachnospiraceae bacterium]|nr:hypothetical protein [Lachnospiraceae bacterium]HCR83252.1 hypothetical protein [Lachnospiraceae bacterium]
MVVESDPLVTAVITTYRRTVEIVRRALTSIINQTYSNIEIIIVNDYPNDKKLAEDLDNLKMEFTVLYPIQYVVVKSNGGACKARNLALSRAKGEFIAFLDDDDEWMPDKITKQVKAIRENSNVALVYCNSQIHYVETGEDKLRFIRKQPEGHIFSYLMAENLIGSCSFPLFRVDELKKVNGFNEIMPALQDWELYFRLLKNSQVAYVDEPLARYYFYKGERISAHPEKRTDAFEIIHKEIESDLEKRCNKKGAASFYLMGTYFYSVSHNMKTAFLYYFRGVKLDPTRVRRNIKDLIRLIGRPFVGNRYV